MFLQVNALIMFYAVIILPSMTASQFNNDYHICLIILRYNKLISDNGYYSVSDKFCFCGYNNRGLKYSNYILEVFVV